MEATQSTEPQSAMRMDADGFELTLADAAGGRRARGMFASYVWAHAKPPECDACELIFGELLGNVAKHAPGPVEIALRWEHGTGILEIGDSGCGYEIAPTLPNDDLCESTRGLFLVEAFGGANLRTYRAANGRNVTHVELPIRRFTEAA
jgi:hypothetical protein